MQENNTINCTDIIKTSTTHSDYQKLYYYLLVLIFPYQYKFLDARKLSGVTILSLKNLTPGTEIVAAGKNEIL